MHIFLFWPRLALSIAAVAVILVAAPVLWALGMGGGRMKRALVDVDGVLANFVGGALAIVNNMLGTRYVSEEVTGFDFCAALGLPRDVAAAVKRAIGATRGFAAELDVLPGAIEGMSRLQRIAEVYIVTSPWNSNATWTHEREAWLHKHFGIAHSRVIHTSAKHICAGDLLVDDKTETCAAWRSAHPRGVAVQWRTAHNRRDAWDGLSTGDWDGLLDIVDGAASQSGAA